MKIRRRDKVVRFVAGALNLLDAAVACHVFVFVLVVACAGSKVASVAHVLISSTTLGNRLWNRPRICLADGYWGVWKNFQIL